MPSISASRFNRLVYATTLLCAYLAFPSAQAMNGVADVSSQCHIEQVAEIPLDLKPTGFATTVLLGGHEALVLVDTGAGYSALGSSTKR